MKSGGDFHRSGNRAPEVVQRRIAHVDMDAFFAAIEVLDRPSLRGKAVIVGGTPEGHGVVSTASYEARRFGVRSAMPAARAVRLCPHGVFLRPRPGRYAAVSRRVFALLEEYTPHIEPLSIDEAWLDLTGCHPLRSRPEAGEDPVRAAAREIRRRVREATGGLTCSLGLAPNKLLAKLASDLEKPDALVVVEPGEVESFLAPVPVACLPGVGPRAAERLERLGLVRIGDIQRMREDDLRRLLGDLAGRALSRRAHGIDDRPVAPRGEPRSVSQERTFAEFLPSGAHETVERILFGMADTVARRLRADGLRARGVTLKVRDERFRTLTRHATLDAPTCVVEDLFAAARTLWRERVDLRGRRVRLLGVGANGLTAEAARQLDIFDGDRGRRRLDAARAADAVAERLGEGAITRGRLLGDHPPREG